MACLMVVRLCLMCDISGLSNSRWFEGVVYVVEVVYGLVRNI